jgi:hypothetical protein
MRMHYEGASAREIARSVRMARSTVQDELKRAAAAKLSWPLGDELTDELLEARLFARSGGGVGAGVRKRQCSGPQDHQDPRALSQRDDAASKLIWLARCNITTDWGRPVSHWKEAMKQFAVLYDDRFTSRLD